MDVFRVWFILATVVDSSHYINGHQVTFEEFWRRGGGPIFFICGILFPIIGYGFVRARNWSRYFFTGLQIAIPVMSLFLGSFDWQILLGLVWIVFVIYYLFWLPSVREYFGV
jgi:hypothetical protein